MDLDSLKDKTKQTTAPTVSGGAPGDSTSSPRDLIAVLTASDAKQIAMLRRGRIFMVIATGAFAFAFTVTFLDPGSGSAVQERRMMYGSLVCIYILVTAVHLLSVRKLARVDYSVPVRRFLDGAELRYRFMRPSDWVMSLAGLMFVAAMMSIGYVPYLSRILGVGEDSKLIYVLIPTFVLAVAAMGLYFTWKNWLRDRAPLWRQIKQMRAELENS
jgi:hypothetical protein